MVSRLNPILISLVLICTVACGGGSGNEQVVVAAGDFETIRATVKLEKVPNAIANNDMSGLVWISIKVKFDTNNNSWIDSSDPELTLSISQSVDTGERGIRARVRVPGDEWTRVGDVGFEVNGDEVTIFVEKGGAESLALISSETQVNVSTSYIDEINEYSAADLLPTSSTYTQVQHNGRILDPRGDYNGNFSEIDILEFRLELLD